MRKIILVGAALQLDNDVGQLSTPIGGECASPLEGVDLRRAGLATTRFTLYLVDQGRVGQAEILVEHVAVHVIFVQCIAILELNQLVQFEISRSILINHGLGLPIFVVFHAAQHDFVGASENLVEHSQVLRIN